MTSSFRIALLAILALAGCQAPTILPTIPVEYSQKKTPAVLSVGALPGSDGVGLSSVVRSCRAPGGRTGPASVADRSPGRPVRIYGRGDRQRIPRRPSAHTRRIHPPRNHSHRSASRRPPAHGEWHRSHRVWIAREGAQGRTGEYPVLLLDEVLSELDMRRREDLLDNLSAAGQIILTASDPDMLPKAFRERAQMWWVEGGTIRPK